MDSERWNRVQEIFHCVVDLPVDDRFSTLHAICADDPTLISEVERLLRADAGGSMLDGALSNVASEVFQGPDPLSSFRELGPYAVKGVLGEGGSGIVYLAERRDLGTPVAIKVLRDSWISPARRSRFAAEQRTLARLNHPYIARLYDARQLPDGTPFFVMEYVAGEALNQYCARTNCSLHARLGLFRSVCEAVQFAHSHAIIHRDLKPSNILVKANGEVRLVDFGIAKTVAQDGEYRTRTNCVLMTPAYAAPEQMTGIGIGTHTDVYALGVILYELLTGELPDREAESRPSAAARRSDCAFSSALAKKREWKDLDVVCLRAMHQDPQRRYRSSEALIRDIDHYLKSEPLEARADTLAYRTSKFLIRNQRAVMAAAVGAALALGLVIFFTIRLASARDAALAEASRAERIQRFMRNLFEAGDREAAPSSELRVIELLDRGVKDARALNNEPRTQAELYQTLGNLYLSLGKLDQAENLLSAALTRRRRLPGDHDREVAESLIALGELRGEQARLPESERLIREAISVYGRELAGNDPAVGRANVALGEILDRRGNYGEAISVLTKAVAIESQTGVLKNDLASALTELANAHYYAGHEQESRALNNRVLVLDRQIYGGGHPNVAQDLMNLGVLEEQNGRYAKAEQFYREALQIHRNWYGSAHPETASSMASLGKTLVKERRDREAEGLLRQALATQERVYGPEHPRVALVVGALGQVALHKRAFGEAAADFHRMLNIYKAAYADHHFSIAVALSYLGEVSFEQNDFRSAERSFREAVQRFTDTQSAEHVNTGIAHVKLGRTLARQRRLNEARAEIAEGLRILLKQPDPPSEWVNSANRELNGIQRVSRGSNTQHPSVMRIAASRPR